MTREEMIFLLEVNTKYSRTYLERLTDEELKKLFEEKMVDANG